MEESLSARLKRVDEFCLERKLKKSSVRWWIFTAELNGLADFKAIVKVGRSVYLDPLAVDRWLASKAR